MSYRWTAPVVNSSDQVLDRYRQRAGLTHGDLFLRYFELGGMSTALQLEAILYGRARAERCTTRRSSHMRSMSASSSLVGTIPFRIRRRHRDQSLGMEGLPQPPNSFLKTGFAHPSVQLKRDDPFLNQRPRGNSVP